MADIQLREQLPASPDLSVGRDLADYDIWVREQFPATPDVSCFPTQWGIRQPEGGGGGQTISGILGLTLGGITPLFSGTVHGNISGSIALTLAGIAAQIDGLVSGNRTAAIALTLDGVLVQISGADGPPARPAMDGAVWRKRRPQEVEREQRMVEEYLQALDQRAAPAAIEPEVVKAEEPHQPILTEVVRAASAEQLRRIEEHDATDERARIAARAERRRRHLLVLMLLAIED